MYYYTAARCTGDLIEGFDSIDKAREAIVSYEAEDKAEDIYTPDFYDIVNEDHMSIEW